MSVNRRSVLKGMALTSIAGVTATGLGSALAAGPASTVTAQPLLALVNEGPAESLFLYGAMAARDSQSQLQVQRVDRDPGFMLEFERELRRGVPMNVIGLLDNASAALVLDMARSGGARIQWLGQHSADAGFSRHHLLRTGIAEGCAQQLSHQLQACGAGFSVTEERQNSAVTSRQLVASSNQTSHSAQWASSIGYLLASLGAPTTLNIPASPNTSLPVTGSFVSFSIKA